MIRRARAITGVLGLMLCAPAHGDDAPPRAPSGGDGVLGQLAAQVRKRLEDASRDRIPKPVPPVPVAVTWKADRIDSIDLGAPLVAMTAADLDRDGKGELYAVTAREVIAIGVVGKRAKELARFSFGGDAAIPQPRDVVGTAHPEGDSVIAAASPWARGLRIRWSGKALVADTGEPAFVVCAGVRAQLVPGRNYFADQTYATRCRDLQDAAGNPLHVRATLSTAGKLDVAATTCAADGTCQAAKTFELGNAGVAFEIADVNRDGTPEIIYSAAVAPGEADTVKVQTLGGAVELTKGWKAGGVAGIGVVDLDGNKRDDVIVALRVATSTRIDLWRLD